jgi:hypothetical protein
MLSMDCYVEMLCCVLMDGFWRWPNIDTVSTFAAPHSSHVYTAMSFCQSAAAYSLPVPASGKRCKDVWRPAAAAAELPKSSAGRSGRQEV